MPNMLIRHDQKLGGVELVRRYFDSRGDFAWTHKGSNGEVHLSIPLSPQIAPEYIAGTGDAATTLGRMPTQLEVSRARGARGPLALRRG